MTPLGILAGGGGIPLELAEAAVGQGRLVHVVGISGEADPAIARFPHTWTEWGQVGRILAALRTAGCREIVIVGQVRRPALRSLKPDFGLLPALPTVLRLLSGGDDSVLRRVVSFFEAKGFRVCGVQDVAPALLAETGLIARCRPSEQQKRDAARGLALIGALAPWDIGQAVAVHDGAVLAIEAAEGTDGLLRRLAERHDRGGVLVKAPKPGQELRVDLPTIGPETVALAARAGLTGVAVEAGRVIIAARRAAQSAADAAGLFLAGVETRAGAPLSESRDSVSAAFADWVPLGRRRPRRRDRIDIATGLEVLRMLSAFQTGAGVVVARAHVLGIDTGEGLTALAMRARGLKQWGDRDATRRRGVLVIRTDDDAAGATLAAASASGLAGLAVAAPAAATSLGAMGDRHGLFVIAQRNGRRGAGQ